MSDSLKKNNESSPGFIFCLSAPSGAGKTSLITALLSRENQLCQLLDLKLSISYTTRPPRPGEQSGREYHFISDSEFDQKIKNKDFLEYATVFKNRYGTSKQWVQSETTEGRSVLLEIDWQGALRIRELFPKEQVILIYILPPSLEALSHRLQTRGKDPKTQLELRMTEAKHEMSYCVNYDYLIINYDFEQALFELKVVLQAHALKREVQLSKQVKLIKSLTDGV